MSFLLLLISTSTELEKNAEQVLPGRKGEVGERWRWGQWGEMTQTMYVHVNK
jgi:hypothetical protein